MKNFVNDYKELALEIDFLVSKQENYLKKFGYVPLQEEIPAVSEAVPENENEHVNAEKEKGQEGDSHLTPVLSDFGLSSPKSKQVREKEEESQQTPVLNLRTKANIVHGLPLSTSTFEDMIDPEKHAISSRDIPQEDEVNEATTPVTPVLNIRKPDEDYVCSARKDYFFTTPIL
ncbi:uncharacterized protein LOC129234407 isoform X2 [Uloborus diversus]|nr:uncharacterized protein LOC129234407 isoform X2 [Uloborus diversus]